MLRLSLRPKRALLTMLILNFLFLAAGAACAVHFGAFPNPDGWSLILTGMLIIIAMAIQNAAHRVTLGSAPPSAPHAGGGDICGRLRVCGGLLYILRDGVLHRATHLFTRRNRSAGAVAGRGGTRVAPATLLPARARHSACPPCNTPFSSGFLSSGPPGHAAPVPRQRARAPWRFHDRHG